MVWNIFSIGNFIIPTDFHSIIFQRGGEKPPTRFWCAKLGPYGHPDYYYIFIVNHIFTIYLPYINHISTIYQPYINHILTRCYWDFPCHFDVTNLTPHPATPRPRRPAGSSPLGHRGDRTVTSSLTNITASRWRWGRRERWQPCGVNVAGKTAVNPGCKWWFHDIWIYINKYYIRIHIYISIYI